MTSQRSEAWAEMLGDLSSGGGSWSATQGGAEVQNNDASSSADAGVIAASSDGDDDNKKSAEPTEDKGGFLDNFEDLYDFLFEKAKTLKEKEVSAVKIVDENDVENIKYMVLPWKDNTADFSFNDISNLPNGYLIAAQYHIHQVASGPTYADAVNSQSTGIPVYVINSIGELWRVQYNPLPPIPFADRSQPIPLNPIHPLAPYGVNMNYKR
jgi:hypothetical protein